MADQLLSIPLTERTIHLCIDMLRRVAVLWSPDDPPAALSLRETEAAARQLSIDVQDTYRTMRCAPEPAFRQILEGIRELRFAA
jgi:hypothetical protein